MSEETPGDRIAMRRARIPRFRHDQAALAKEVGVGRDRISKWENNHARPLGENLLRLAEVLGVEPEWIMHGGNRGRGGPRLVAERPTRYDASEERVRYALSEEVMGAMQPRDRLDYLLSLYAQLAREGAPRSVLDAVHEAIDAERKNEGG